MKNEYGFDADDVKAYRQKTGASMMDAKKHFMGIYRDSKRAEMAALIQSGTLEDINKIVKILVEDY